MQRAQEKETMAKATAVAGKAAATKKAAEQWTRGDDETTTTNTNFENEADKKEGKEKVLTVTYAPRSHFIARGTPARVSFGGHNKHTELMNAEKKERDRAAKAIVAANRAPASDVSDLEMATAMGKNSNIAKTGKNDFKRPPPLQAAGAERDGKKPKK